MKLLIENDEFVDELQWERMNDYFETPIVFDVLITNAYKNSVEAYEAILQADEIYAETSFLDDGGRLMDDLAYHLRIAGIKGKKFFIFKREEDLNLWRLKRPFDLKYLLENNDMFCLSGRHGSNNSFVKFNPEKLCN